MREIYVVVRETSPAGSGLPIEAYTDSQKASDVVLALRTKNDGDKYAYTMIPLDRDMETPFRVTFYPGSFKWMAEAILTEPQDGKRFVEKPEPQVRIAEWVWPCIYALDRGKAIERAKSYAQQAIVRGGF